MRQSYRIIPTYTADVSGVCSALYELGGMTVMHDPSGCNSTYNTHDEIRWYDQDSLIFISGLSEIDAIMGNDDKFVHDTEKAARELKPKFIALASSPIPFLNGTDFPALAEILETETGIPAFAVPTNGMHDYVYGAGKALEAIAQRFTGPASARAADSFDANHRKINILGVTPLDFGPLSHGESMKRYLEGKGWQVISTWAMGDDLESLSRAGEASVNLVVSSVGLRAAKVLREKFGTPYVTGAPVGAFAGPLTAAMERAAERGECSAAYLNANIRMTANNSAGEQKSGEIALIGEPVTMGSLAAAIEMQYRRPVRVICPLEEWQGLLTPKDEAVRGEEEIEERLKSVETIIADPLYRPVCPKNCHFYELPHIAFSGRIYLKIIKKLPGFADLLSYGE